MFVIAYPRETQEMVLDAHNQAFAFFGGVPKRMVYDNLKTVVDAIFSGKERQFNRRFLTLANHYLFEPIACTPESGWEKGQVEKQVCDIRSWLFTPTPNYSGPVNFTYTATDQKGGTSAPATVTPMPSLGVRSQRAWIMGARPCWRPCSTASAPTRPAICIPIGRPSLLWGTAKNPPFGTTNTSPDNFLWSLTRRRVCCVGYALN